MVSSGPHQARIDGWHPANRAKLDQVQAIHEKRRVLLTTRAGRQEKVTSWRAAITARPASYLDFPGPTVLFAIQIGALRVRSAPQQGPHAVHAAIELRTRFITAFEHGWSLTDLQTDLATTFRGHFGQRALSDSGWGLGSVKFEGEIESNEMKSFIGFLVKHRA